MVQIESTMERIARIYSRDTGVSIEFGAGFATDCKNKIYIPPITDQHDQWVRFMTEAGVYHEVGHILYTKQPPVADRALHGIINSLEDTREEVLFAEKYPGVKSKQRDFLIGFLKRDPKRWENPQVDMVKKILDLTYLRAKEIQLGVDFNLTLPQELEALWNKLISDLLPAIAAERDEMKLVAIAEEIFKRLKDLRDEQQDQEKQKQEQKEKQEKQDKGDQDQEPQTGDGQPEDNQDGKPSKGKDQDGDQEPQSGDGQGESSDQDGDQESQSGDGQGESSDQDGDQESQSGDGQGEPSDQDGDQESQSGDGQGEDSDQGGQPSDRGNQQGKSKAGKGDKEITTKASDMLVDLYHGQDTLMKEAQDQVKKYADTNHVYRDQSGLRDTFYKQNPRQGWEGAVNRQEELGRKLTGYIGAKLRTLFISEHSQRWYRCQRSGRLDLRRISQDHSEAIYKKKDQYTKEDSAVFLVVDNSGSMSGSKANIALALMTTLATEMDRLRIPFAVAGFTGEGSDNTYTRVGIRTQPCIIQDIKLFEEPYRSVRHRFVWPTVMKGTPDFPCFKYGAEKLAVRRESKKVIFVISDGETATGSFELNNAMRAAYKAYVNRLLRAGFKVVGFEIDDYCLADIIPQTIHINSMELDQLPAKFYGELMKILVHR